MFTRTQGAVRDIPVESFGACFQPQGQFGSAMNIHAILAQTSQPRFLMCPPRHFAVAYSINPWMDPQAWADGGAELYADAQRQWASLHRALAAAGAAIEMLEPAPGLPDLVFTANAAVVLDRKVVLTRFRHGERQGEEPVFAASFRALQARGLIDEILQLPADITLEGAGDCIWDSRRGLFWLGSGFRSDAAAGPVLGKYLSVQCLTLALADPSFYHLDTAFCALPCGSVIYYPAAFTPAALATIHERVAPGDRIELHHADATRFAANAVSLDRSLVLSSCSETLRSDLEQRGYAVVETPLHAFLRSGGSACCLTLRLDHRSSTREAGSPIEGDRVPLRARGAAVSEDRPPGA
jgi:N-dimethylarginine dimethylaminohydrolase